MRVSIWQQWASNHSSLYFIVGTFDTTDHAEAAYHELRGILGDISLWHKAHPEALEKAWGSSDPLPPELAVAQQYNIEWPRTIDWTNWACYFDAGEKAEATDRRLIDEAQSLVANVIFMSTPDQTWMGIEPFRSLLERLGANRIFAVDNDTMPEPDPNRWRMQLRCIAPDQQKAQELCERIGGYWSDSRPEDEKPLPPWSEVKSNFEAAGKSGAVKREMLASLEEQLGFANEIDEPYRTRRWKGSFDISAGEVFQDGQNLSFTFHLVGDLAFAALVSYLQVNGCRDFRCAFTIADEEGS